jgi:hypothetical protein
MSEITATKRIQYSEYERLFKYYALLRGNIRVELVGKA